MISIPIALIIFGYLRYLLVWPLTADNRSLPIITIPKIPVVKRASKQTDSRSHKVCASLLVGTWLPKSEFGFMFSLSFEVNLLLKMLLHFRNIF